MRVMVDNGRILLSWLEDYGLRNLKFASMNTPPYSRFSNGVKSEAGRHSLILC